MHRPITLQEARQAGITKRQLQSSAWQRIGPSTYKPTYLDAGPLQLLQVAAQRLPPDAAFSGTTAAWLLGLDTPPTSPIEATVPRGSVVAAKAGVKLHRADLRGDVVFVRGLRATSIVRVLADLALWLPLAEALPLVDQSLHRRLLSIPQLADRARKMAGRPGSRRLHRLIELADGRAESLMESCLRLLLIEAGLGAPTSQVDLVDGSGTVIARCDLYYPTARLAIEYDGANHRDRLVDDNRRQNLLLAAGYRLLRFTAADVYTRPSVVAAQVRAALAA